MTALSEASGPFEMTEWPEDRESTITDFCDLLEELTSRDQEPDAVHDNVDRVLRSPTSHLLVVERAGRVASTLTVNAYPTLTGEGTRAWIDDVSTLPEAQRNGLSKQLMAAGEELAAPSGEVYLTSKPDRGVARSFYESRGYELLNEADEPLVVFRSTTIGKEEDPTAPLSVEELTPGFHHNDVGDLARLLDVDPYQMQRRMLAIVGSPTTRTFIVRTPSGEIVGVATGNETPIPVGKKPWIDDIKGRDADAEQTALEAAGKWLGGRYKYVNIVAAPDTEFGNGFAVRNTGLYVKRLGGIATA
jgi:Acetyltransferases